MNKLHTINEHLYILAVYGNQVAEIWNLKANVDQNIVTLMLKNEDILSNKIKSYFDVIINYSIIPLC